MSTSIRARVARAALTGFAAGGCLIAGSTTVIAQPAPPNGPRQVDPRWHALVHATLIPAPGEKVEDATIVFRDGVILSVEAAAPAPDGARVWDCSGLTVYPGLIDAHLPVDAPRPDAAMPGAHWNGKVTPERTALDGAGVDEKTKKEMRKLGFTAALIAPRGGIFRGQTAVILLDGEAGATASSERRDVVAPLAFNEVAFDAGDWQGREYPGSKMGAIALIRQTLLDAQWHLQCLDVYGREPSKHEPVIPSAGLIALGKNAPDSTPLLFDVADEQDALRAIAIAHEFNRACALVGAGTEFRRLDGLAAAQTPIIVPLNFPEDPKVATPSEAEAVSLRDLMTWEQAPTNPRRLAASGLTVALTTDKLKKRDQFTANLRKAIEHGLTEDDALAMLTTAPAEILGVDDRLGRVAPGMLANFVVVDGASLFDKKTKIRDVWVGGRRHEVTAAPDVKLEGAWAVTFEFPNPMTGEFILTKTDRGHAVKVSAEEKEGKGRNVSLRENRLTFLVDGKPWDVDGVFTLSAVVEGERMFGTGVDPFAEVFSWSATRTGDAPKEKPRGQRARAEGEAEAEEGANEADKPALAAADADDDAARKPEVPEDISTPFGAFGLMAPPEQRTVAVINATIWTSGPSGVIENGALLVSGGKVAWVGPMKGFNAPNDAYLIDAEGRHVTPGLIDCHSHSGIAGSVNEGTQAVTCEVRIGDVIDPDDMAIYRELAGGLTAANQLHGSANPIGGQNSVVKLRWGVDRAEDMRIDGAIAGVKFALGENVKQSNWGENFTTRYPQTRMGVETIIRDRFTAARDYAREWTAWLAHRGGNPSDFGMTPAVAKSLEKASGWDLSKRNAIPQPTSAMPPRRDLELDALAEILAGDRLIHCHSYRQDEILMLCRVARDFGFRIGTFQHVLEGYKVAEAIRDSALGGSTFSDWWAYKFEVYDAIPENGAIMNEVGVCVSFNSDSDELARRMNTEAAKAVKYGAVPPAEALKFVTLNPAKQLKIDHRVGSLEVGKDGDFVVWSGDPLSSLSRCEATWIDGREYFSLDRDAELRAAARTERNRIVQKLLTADKAGGAMAGRGGAGGEDAGDDARPTESMSLMERVQYEALERHYLDMLRAGIDPESSRCGVCGCDGASLVLLRP